MKLNDTCQLLNECKKKIHSLYLSKQINNCLSNNITIITVHYLLKIKIKENVSNRDYIYHDISTTQ